MLSKEALVRIHKKSAISDAHYLALLKDIQEETGALLMEGNLKKEIQDSINAMRNDVSDQNNSISRMANNLITYKVLLSSLKVCLCLLKINLN